MKKEKQTLNIVIGIMTIIVMSFLLSGCSEEFIEYEGTKIPMAELSEGSIFWIENFNSLEESDKEFLRTRVPLEIQKFLPKKEDEISKEEVNEIGKVIEVNKTNIIVATDIILNCKLEDTEKFKAGQTVEVVYKRSRDTEIKELEINPISVTVIAESYNILGLYKSIIKEEIKGEENIVVDVMGVKSLSDSDKLGLRYLLSEDEIPVESISPTMGKTFLYFSVEKVDSEEIEGRKLKFKLDITKFRFEDKDNSIEEKIEYNVYSSNKLLEYEKIS